MNSKFNLIYEQIMKDMKTCVQKPVELKAEQLTEKTTIHSLQGDVVGNKGDWLITGVKGEQWPVRDEVFKKKYQKGSKEGYWKKKPIECKCYKLTEPKEWTSWNGDKMMAEPGDWMIVQPDGNESSIKDDIFQKTYEIK